MAIKKARVLANEERNKRIEQMDINELKKYLCLKNGQNPDKCFECVGKSTCKAGQRAIVLLSGKEKAEEKQTDGTEKKLTKKEITERNRMVFISACQQEAPIKWLMERDSISRDAAMVKLKYWAKRYPEEALRYDYTNSIARDVVQRRESSWNRLQKEQSMAEYREAMSHENPVEYLMESRGISKKQAVQKIGNWKINHGKIVPDTEEKTMTEHADQQSDKMSLDEFLGMVAGSDPGTVDKFIGMVDGNETNVADVEEVSKDREETDVSTAVPEESSVSAALAAKRDQIVRKMEKAEQEIAALQARIEELKKARESVEITIRLFTT